MMSHREVAVMASHAVARREAVLLEPVAEVPDVDLLPVLIPTTVDVINAEELVRALATAKARTTVVPKNLFPQLSRPGTVVGAAPITPIVLPLS
jgi:hypothetical protein